MAGRTCTCRILDSSMYIVGVYAYINLSHTWLLQIVPAGYTIRSPARGCSMTAGHHRRRHRKSCSRWPCQEYCPPQNAVHPASLSASSSSRWGKGAGYAVCHFRCLQQHKLFVAVRGPASACILERMGTALSRCRRKWGLHSHLVADYGGRMHDRAQSSGSSVRTGSPVDTT